MKRPPLSPQTRKPLFLASLALSLSLHLGCLYLLVTYSSSFLNVRALEMQYRDNDKGGEALLEAEIAPSHLLNGPAHLHPYPHPFVGSMDSCADFITSFTHTPEKCLDLLLPPFEESPSLHPKKKKGEMQMTERRISLEYPPLAKLKGANSLPTISHRTPVREEAKGTAIYSPYPKQVEGDLPTDFEKDLSDEKRLKTTPLLTIPLEVIIKKKYENFPHSTTAAPSVTINRSSQQTLTFVESVETHPPKPKWRAVEEHARCDLISNLFAPLFASAKQQLDLGVSSPSRDLVYFFPTEALKLCLELCSTTFHPPSDAPKRIVQFPNPSSTNIDCSIDFSSLPSLDQEEIESLYRVNHISPIQEKTSFRATMRSETDFIERFGAHTPDFVSLPKTCPPLLSPSRAPLEQNHRAFLFTQTCFNLPFLTGLIQEEMEIQSNEEPATTASQAIKKALIEQQEKEGKSWRAKPPLIAHLEGSDQSTCSPDPCTSIDLSSLLLLDPIYQEKSHLYRLPSNILKQLSRKIQEQRDDFSNMQNPYLPCKESAHSQICAADMRLRCLGAIPLDMKGEGLKIPLTFDEVKAPLSALLEMIKPCKSIAFRSKKMSLSHDKRDPLPPVRLTQVAPKTPLSKPTYPPFLLREEGGKPPDLCWKRRKQSLMREQKIGEDDCKWIGKDHRADEALSFLSPLHFPRVSNTPPMKNRCWQTKKSIHMLPSEMPKIGQDQPIFTKTHEIPHLEEEIVSPDDPYWSSITPRVLAWREESPPFGANDLYFFEKKGGISRTFSLKVPPVFQGQISDLQKTMHIPRKSIGQLPTIDRLATLCIEPRHFEAPVAPLRREKVEDFLQQMVLTKELRALKPQMGDLESKEMGNRPLPKMLTKAVAVDFPCPHLNPNLSKQGAQDINPAHRFRGGHFLETLTTSNLKMTSFRNDFKTTVTYVEKSNSRGYHFALNIQPNEKLSFTAPEQNFIFILDCSSTIKKHRYNTFKEALIKAIPYMNKGDSFNIVLADSTIIPMSEKPLVWDKGIINDVRAYLDKCEYRGYFSQKNSFRLLAEMAKFFDPNRENVVILLTDGQSFNTIKKHKDAFKKLAEKSRGVFSLFTASASQGNNTTMLGLVSNFNNGELMYSSTHAAFPRKLAIFIKHIKHLVAKDVYLEAIPKNETKIQFYPGRSAYPVLYADRPYTIYGSIDKLEDFELILQGHLKTQWIHIKQHISFKEAKKAGHEFKRHCALQTAYAHYADYLQKNDPYLLEEAESILKHYDLHSNIR